MASYTGPGGVGARGFATGTSRDGSPQTLTKYIWEYLGNPIPDEVYARLPTPDLAGAPSVDLAMATDGATAPGGNGGCSCRVSDSPADVSASLAFGLLLAVVLRRRYCRG
jgi:MYXO-CTERM domain-containing protein